MAMLVHQRVPVISFQTASFQNIGWTEGRRDHGLLDGAANTSGREKGVP